ncbi:DUF6895 family protein [Kribbella sp. ALI-6-A]|uniref:DUF6895 family protein n=1 Tax=Kribbella sp. ALI-6-A TaxID=1933817 RepID=UPI002687472A
MRLGRLDVELGAEVRDAVANISSRIVRAALFEGTKLGADHTKVCAEALLLCRLTQGKWPNDGRMTFVRNASAGGLASSALVERLNNDAWSCGREPGAIGVVLATILQRPVPDRAVESMRNWLAVAVRVPGGSAWDNAERLWAAIHMTANDRNRIHLQQEMRRLRHASLLELLSIPTSILHRSHMFSLTHIMLYAADFGVGSALDLSPLGEDVSRLLYVWLASSFVRADLDLTVEILLVIACYALPWLEQADICLTFCVQQLLRTGSVTDRVRRRRWAWPEGGWEPDYHTTFLIGMLTTFAFRNEGRSNWLGQPAGDSVHCCAGYRPVDEVGFAVLTFLGDLDRSRVLGARWLLDVGRPIGHADDCWTMD